jgi:hypothetical protein
MISAKLKQHFIKKKVSKMLTNAASVDRQSKNKKILSVGIITKEKYSQEYDLPALITAELQLRNPKVFSFRKFEKNQEVSYKHFTEKDFNWKAEITNPGLENFINEPFDLLICYYTKPNTHLDYVSFLSQATFKVGFAALKSQLFDLEIAVQPDQVDAFFAETKKYLTILKKL